MRSVKEGSPQQVSFLNSPDSVPSERVLQDPYVKAVYEYMHEPDIQRRRVLLEGMSQSPAVIDYHLTASMGLNVLYELQLSPVVSRSITRGRELFDGIAKSLGQKVDQRRHELDALLSRKNDKAVAIAFPEISLLEEKPGSSHPIDNCFSFAFGFSGMDYESFMQSPQGQSFSASLPVPGAVALYYFDQTHLTHAGRVTGDGKIVSRWGRGPVFEHPIDLVPTYYGRVETFLLKIA